MNLADKEKCNLYKELRGLKRIIEQSHGRLAKYRVCEAQTVFHQHAINLSMIFQNQVGLQILINIITLYIFKKLYKNFWYQVLHMRFPLGTFLIYLLL